MSNSIDFGDLEDSGEWTGSTSPRRRWSGPAANLQNIPRYTVSQLEKAAQALSLGAARSVATVARFPCFKCRGSGRFISWSGRDCGACNRCNGTGKQKTDPNVARARAEKREQKAAARALQLQETFRLNNPEIAAWLEAKKATFDFAKSLDAALNEWGTLTDGQIAAVQKCIDRDKQYESARAARKPDADVAGAGFTKMLAAFAAAKAAGLKYPKLIVNGYEFSLAGASSANAGCLYVKTLSGLYIGKITAAGAFFASRDANSQDRETIAIIGADPLAAAVAHGKQTGRCSCCNRLLENEESVRLGIGPICRDKWGL